MRQANETPLQKMCPLCRQRVSLLTPHECEPDTAGPLSFSLEMARAVYREDKTETRRVVRPQPVETSNPNGWAWFAAHNSPYATCRSITEQGLFIRMASEGPYSAGQLRYIQEPWELLRTWPAQRVEVRYRADQYRRVVQFSPERFDALSVIHSKGNKPARFMPREVARGFVGIRSVRVERVRDIDDDAARREGIGFKPVSDEWATGDGPNPVSYVKAFRQLWDTLNEKRGFGWDENPAVWVLWFHLVTTKE